MENLIAKFGKGSRENEVMTKVTSDFDDFAEQVGIVGITEEVSIKYKKGADGKPTKEVSSYYLICEMEDGSEDILLVSKPLVADKKGSLSLDDYDSYPIYAITKDRVTGAELAKPIFMIAKNGAAKRAKKSLAERKAAKAAAAVKANAANPAQAQA